MFHRLFNNSKDTTPQLFIENEFDFAYKLGKKHVKDRSTQLAYYRIIGQGRTAEFLCDSKEALIFDFEMRKLGFDYYSKRSLGDLNKTNINILEQYCKGVNEEFSNLNKRKNKIYWNWSPQDSLSLLNLFTYYSTSKVQTDFFKLFFKLIRDGNPVKNLESIFDLDFSITDPTFINQIEKINHLPIFQCKTNWFHPTIISNKSIYINSEKPLYAHQYRDSSERVNSYFYDLLLNIKDELPFYGLTIPGVPGYIAGQGSKHSIFLNFTNVGTTKWKIRSVVDDNYIFENKKYYFSERQEKITKSDGSKLDSKIYLTDNSTLDTPIGSKIEDGDYLSFSNILTTVSFQNSLLSLMNNQFYSKSREQIPILIKKVNLPFYWNIGIDRERPYILKNTYKVNTEIKSKKNMSFHKVNMEKVWIFPGILEEENNSFRPSTEHIKELINQTNEIEQISTQELKGLIDRKYTPVTSLYIAKLTPYLRDTPSSNILKKWDGQESDDSMGSFLFDQFYMELIKLTFFDHYIKDELFFKTKDFYPELYQHYFDQILLSKNDYSFLFQKPINEFFKIALDNTFKKWPYTRLINLKKQNQNEVKSADYQSKKFNYYFSIIGQVRKGRAFSKVSKNPLIISQKNYHINLDKSNSYQLINVMDPGHE